MKIKVLPKMLIIITHLLLHNTTLGFFTIKRNAIEEPCSTKGCPESQCCATYKILTNTGSDQSFEQCLEIDKA